MALTVLDDVLGKKVVTQDAIILGEVTDVRYETLTWNILGFKVRAGSTAVTMLGPVVAKSTSILLEPGKYVINDVVLLPDKMESARSKITTDNDNFASAVSIGKKKVFTSDGILLGSVSSINIDLTKWRIVSFKIKLDKGAYPLLDIKKGLLPKKISGILTSHVDSIAGNVGLTLTMEKVKGQIVITD